MEDEDFDIAPTPDDNKEENEQNEAHQNAKKFVEAMKHNIKRSRYSKRRKMTRTMNGTQQRQRTRPRA